MVEEEEDGSKRGSAAVEYSEVGRSERIILSRRRFRQKFRFQLNRQLLRREKRRTRASSLFNQDCVSDHLNSSLKCVDFMNYFSRIQLH